MHNKNIDTLSYEITAYLGGGESKDTLLIGDNCENNLTHKDINSFYLHSIITSKNIESHDLCLIPSNLSIGNYSLYFEVKSTTSRKNRANSYINFIVIK